MLHESFIFGFIVYLINELIPIFCHLSNLKNLQLKMLFIGIQFRLVYFFSVTRNGKKSTNITNQKCCSFLQIDTVYCNSSYKAQQIKVQ